MAKLTLADGTIIEGTPQELYDISQKFGVKAEEVAELRVGDRVEIADKRASEYNRPTRITVGEITDIDFGEGFAEYPYRVDGAGTFDRFPASALRKVADKPKVEPLKVEDFVIISGKSVFGVDLDGKLGVYGGTSIHFTPSHARVTDIVGKGYVVKYEQLRKATDEEVAKAKADIAEYEQAKADVEARLVREKKDAIFTQARRKPNEYRKGDIALLTTKSYGEFYGEIVGESDGFSTVRYRFVNFKDGGTSTENVESLTLIATVESRLDRK